MAEFPRGIRLNNPGNIDRGEVNWLGMSKLQDDPRFVRFETPRHGIRAIMKILRSYEKLHDLNTISKIINRWAPPSENNTFSYTINVSNCCRIHQDQLIDTSSIDILIALAKAIIKQENGASPKEMPIDWYEEVVYHNAGMDAING